MILSTKSPNRTQDGAETRVSSAICMVCVEISETASSNKFSKSNSSFVVSEHYMVCIFLMKKQQNCY